MIKKKFQTGYKTAAALLSFVLSAATVSASELHQEDGILTNHSAEYVRTLNRNTSTDPDAAFYNPAGLVFMAKDGLHISFSMQSYHVEKAHTLDFYAIQNLDNPGMLIPVQTYHERSEFEGTLADEYPAKLTAPVPGLDIIWKQDKWAAFFDLAVMQAAIDMTYGNGLAVLDWGNLLIKETGLSGAGSTDQLIMYHSNANAVRNEMFLGITLGGAYEFVNWLSAAGGVRLIHASGNMSIRIRDVNYVLRDTSNVYSIATESDWDIDTDYEGFGAGFILSSHCKVGGLVPALKGLDATLRIEYYLPMELEKKTNKFVAPGPIEASGNLDIFKDGSSNPAFATGRGKKILKATYPPTVNLGLSYLLLGWINIVSSGQVSLRQMVDLDGREKDYNVGYQAGIGAEFILNPKVTLSLGYLYNDFGIKPECRTEADMLLTSHQIGAGGKFNVDENLDINIGAFYQYFVPATTYYVKSVDVSDATESYLSKDFKEMRFSLAVGATYRMFSSDEGFVDDENDTKQGKKEKQIK